MSSRTLCPSPDFYFSSLLIQYHPNLQLQLLLTESVIELFTILQSNTTVKALRVKIRESWHNGSWFRRHVDTTSKNRISWDCHFLPCEADEDIIIFWTGTTSYY